MANKFDIGKIIKTVLSSKEWILIAFLALVALTMFIFLARGAKKTPEDYVPIVTKIRPEDIKFPNAAAQNVAKTIADIKPFDESAYKNQMLSRNLYDFRDVMTRYDFERKIYDKLKTAQTYFDQKNFDEVIRICQEILAQDSTREPALRLKEKAEKAKIGG